MTTLYTKAQSRIQALSGRFFIFCQLFTKMNFATTFLSAGFLSAGRIRLTQQLEFSFCHFLSVDENGQPM